MMVIVTHLTLGPQLSFAKFTEKDGGLVFKIMYFPYTPPMPAKSYSSIQATITTISLFICFNF